MPSLNIGHDTKAGTEVLAAVVPQKTDTSKVVSTSAGTASLRSRILLLF